jgi:uncharacterized membrane protein YdbT with pleckstrin-like domain
MQLLDGETVLHELRPEPVVAKYWLVMLGGKVAAGAVLVSGLLTAIVLGHLDVLTDSNRETPVAIVIVATIAVALLAGLLAVTIAYLYFRALRRTYTYAVTNQRCILHGGLFIRVERSIPYHKVTDVEVTQDIIERFLRISRVQVFTPGTAGTVGEITFAGLDDAETPAATINGILQGFRATGE